MPRTANTGPFWADWACSLAELSARLAAGHPPNCDNRIVIANSKEVAGSRLFYLILGAVAESRSPHVSGGAEDTEGRFAVARLGG